MTSTMVKGARWVALVGLLAACANGVGPEVVEKSCQEHADCPGSQVCDAQQKVCVSLVCTSNEDCGAGQRCLSDGTCKVADCETDAECCDGVADCALTCVDFQCTGSECEVGQTQRCFVDCHEGTKTCEKGIYSECSAPPKEDTETCGDGIDNDCNGKTDEECAACQPGQTRACSGPCGEGEQRCTAEGQWDACDAPSDCSCEQGETTTQPCGMCGELAGTCSPEGTWIFSSLCTGEGECSLGAVEQQDCGNCGKQIRQCTDECTWGEWSKCGDEGPCEPGDEELQGCQQAGACGESKRICTDQCTWTDWTVCDTGMGGCVAGEAQEKSCGLCGVQVSTCDTDCNWGVFGACMDEGICQPNQIQVEDCGFCGERQRTCTEGCEWGEWSACSGGGSCEPGDTEEQDCGPSSTKGICELGSQVRTCNSACQWNTWGSCLGATYPKTEICGNGIDEDCSGEDTVQPDTHEPNDSCGTCTHLGDDPNLTLNATFDNPDDEVDFYCFNGIDQTFGVPGFDEVVVAELIDQDLGVDGDLFLYKGTANCQSKSPLDSSVTIGPDDEKVEFSGTTGTDDGGLFIIEVRNYGDSGCSKGYTLKVDGLN